jgi:uncharacterized protein involved in exopolysaccharide biosynthesis
MPTENFPSFAALSAALRRVWPGLWSSLRLGLIAGLVTACITLFIPNRYASVARILPAPTQNQGMGSLALLAATAGATLPGADDPGASYVDILESRTVLEAVLNTRYQFHQRAWRFGSSASRDETLFEYLDKPNMDLAMLALKTHLSITRDFKTKLLAISVETKSPELSQQIARRLVQLLDQFAVEKARTRGTEKAVFTAERLDEERHALDVAQDAFQKFLEMNRNYATSPDPAIRLKGARLEMEYHLQQQLLATLALNREQALLDAKNDIPVLNVLDPGNLPVDKSGPARSFIVLFFMLLITVTSYALRQIHWRVVSPAEAE